MSCPFCGRDVCLCGEAYKNLTEKELTKLFYVVYQKAKETLPELDVKVMGIDLDTWLMNEGMNGKTPTFRSISADLDANGTLPVPYLTWMAGKKGRSVRDTLTALVDDPLDNLLMFPLVMVIYRRYHTRQMKMAYNLLNNTLSYLKVNQLASVLEEGIVKYSDGEVREEVYINRCLQDLWKIKFPDNPETTVWATSDTTLVKLILDIMSTTSPRTVYEGALFYMIRIAAKDKETIDEWTREYKENGMTPDLLDNLIDLDSTLIGDMLKENIETSWVM